jgi:hypothetical protein
MSAVWTFEENMQPTVDKSIKLKKVRADMEGKVVWVLVSRKTLSISSKVLSVSIYI